MRGALTALAGLAGFVVYTSLRVGDVRCEVCIEFVRWQPGVVLPHFPGPRRLA